MTEKTIPLKQKYLTRKDPGFKSKTSNKGESKAKREGWGHRRRAYGPFNTF